MRSIMSKLKPTRPIIYLILDNIRSAHNVGAILRTADAVGVARVYLCGYTPTPDKHAKIAKTALGAEQTVPWEHQAQTWRLVEQLKKQSIRVMALEQDRQAEDIFNIKPTFPLALIVGNEVNGISKSLLQRVNKIIAIPQYGSKESLNVSVATGVALYIIAHQ